MNIKPIAGILVGLGLCAGGGYEIVEENKWIGIMLVITGLGVTALSITYTNTPKRHTYERI